MGRGRAPCCDKSKVRTGPWSPAEDLRLMNFIQNNGHSNWRALPKQAGLLRCGKSCRLRWINYLRPDVKRGNFTPEEENTIIQLHTSIGNKWSKIASCLPGRTDNEIKNVWNTHLKKRLKKSALNSKMDAKPDSPSSSCSSNPPPKLASSSGNDDVVMAATLDFDVDFWEVLESLDPLKIPQGSSSSSSAGAGEENLSINVEGKVDGEEEVAKWLSVLENELGLG